MTSLKVVFAVGIFLGAGALAWTTDSVAKAEVAEKLKMAVDFIKREVTAFAKFIGTDVSDGRATANKFEDQPAVTAKQSEPWKETKLTDAIRRSL